MLSTVNRQGLPAVLTSAFGSDGSLYEFQAIRGGLTIEEGGRFAKELVVRDVLDGLPSDTTEGRWSGTYIRTDTTLVVRFTGQQGGLIVVTYQLLDGGGRLRGLEGSFPPQIYEYVRE